MKVRRADKLGEPGIITNQIIHEIETADLVVADLSFGNPNVFYELAIRHVTRKPFVHVIQRGNRIPFDNAPVRAIDFDLTDLRSFDAAKKELRSQAAAAMEIGSSESPISMAATLESLRHSGNPNKIAIADVLAELTSLRASVDGLAASQEAADKRRRAAALLAKALSPTSASPSTQPTTLGQLLSSADALTAPLDAPNALSESLARLFTDGNEQQPAKK
jgi:hypothetical protein